ncbi:MAG TPA: ABC transporter permease [Ktedonobacteraceae bacterium]|nr:ABC transporter permease [Ktedonobacteraceae bacterium]
MQTTNVSNPNVNINAPAPSPSFAQVTKKTGSRLWKALTANPKITFGLTVVAIFILLSLAAPVLTHYAPNDKVSATALAPSAEHLMGTTGLGQDMLSQLLYGARVSLMIGFIAAIGSTALQIIFGVAAGYFGGVIDEVLSLITNIFLVLPGLPLAIVIAALANGASVNKNEYVIALVLLITSWSYGARVLRAQTLSLREREFVTASRASGESSFRVIFFEIVPNEVALVASTFVGTFVYAIGAEVALEYLGLGDSGQASWGTILFWAQNNGALLTGQWWQFVPAGLCVAVVCAALTFVNFGIDEIANPNLRNERKIKVPKQRRAAA